MDVQLSELIDKIKKEGIESAQKEAAKLKADTETEAQKIIENARREAGVIIAQAQDDAKRSVKAGVAALDQASRNLILAFKGEIQELLNKLIAEGVSASYSADVIKGILPDLIKNWAVKNTDSLTVLLSEADAAKLDAAFRAKLAEVLKGGVEIKPVKKIDCGFHIVEKDGSAFYDFSAEAVVRLLCAYLNPQLAQILADAAKGN